VKGLARARSVRAAVADYGSYAWRSERTAGLLRATDRKMLRAAPALCCNSCVRSTNVRLRDASSCAAYRLLGGDDWDESGGVDPLWRATVISICFARGALII